MQLWKIVFNVNCRTGDTRYGEETLVVWICMRTLSLPGKQLPSETQRLICDTSFITQAFFRNKFTFSPALTNHSFDLQPERLLNKQFCVHSHTAFPPPITLKSTPSLPSVDVMHHHTAPLVVSLHNERLCQHFSLSGLLLPRVS